MEKSRGKTPMSDEERRARDRQRKATKKAKMTPAQANANREKEKERIAQLRAAQTSAQADAYRERERNRKAEKKSKETSDQVAANREIERERGTKRRAARTPDEREARNLQNAAIMAAARANESAEEREIRNNRNAVNMAAARANETAEETEIRNNQNALNMAATRNSKKSNVNFKDAMRTTEILDGSFIVKSLHETADRIGGMTIECNDCKALKFPGETPSSCCLEGKVALPHYPRPPEPLMELWTGTDDRSKVMRGLSRTLNGAVCLTSLKNHAPRRDGWRPSVILQGRVVTRAGPLMPENGESPVFTALHSRSLP